MQTKQPSVQIVKSIVGYPSEKAIAFVDEVRRNTGVDIILHPPALPSPSHFNVLLNPSVMSCSTAVEFDVRVTQDQSALIQHSEFTDTLKGWDKITNIGQLHTMVSKDRLSILMCTDSYTIEDVKRKLRVRDLTLSEFKTLAGIGEQEVLDVQEFLNRYNKSGSTRKLMVDSKDPQSSRVALDAIITRGRLPSVYLIIENDEESFKSTKKMVEGQNADVPVGLALRSELRLKRDGADALVAYARNVPKSLGVQTVITKITQLPIICEVVKGYNVVAYVPPQEREKPAELIQLIRANPNVRALEVDID